jgi:hypothetical protein
VWAEVGLKNIYIIFLIACEQKLSGSSRLFFYLTRVSRSWNEARRGAEVLRSKFEEVSKHSASLERLSNLRYVAQHKNVKHAYASQGCGYSVGYPQYVCAVCVHTTHHVCGVCSHIIPRVCEYENLLRQQKTKKAEK